MIVRLVTILIVIIFGSIALQDLSRALSALLPPLIVFAVVAGIGVLLFQRRRRW